MGKNHDPKTPDIALNCSNRAFLGLVSTCSGLKGKMHMLPIMRMCSTGQVLFWMTGVSLMVPSFLVAVQMPL